MNRADFPIEGKTCLKLAKSVHKLAHSTDRGRQRAHHGVCPLLGPPHPFFLYYRSHFHIRKQQPFWLVSHGPLAPQQPRFQSIFAHASKQKVSRVAICWQDSCFTRERWCRLPECKQHCLPTTPNEGFATRTQPQAYKDLLSQCILQADYTSTELPCPTFHVTSRAFSPVVINILQGCGRLGVAKWAYITIHHLNGFKFRDRCIKMGEWARWPL